VTLHILHYKEKILIVCLKGLHEPQLNITADKVEAYKVSTPKGGVHLFNILPSVLINLKGLHNYEVCHWKISAHEGKPPFLTQSSSSFSFSLCLFEASDFSFLLMDPFRHLVRLLGRGISPAPRPLPTQDNTTQRNTDTHPCPEQDSNLWSQCSNGRRQCLA
jgi:hypothetical protein